VTALAGLKVVDLANLLAAPQVSAILADLGADVVKVEPPFGDPLASLGVRRGGSTAPYLLANRGKRLVRLDPEAQQADLHRLLDAADLIVANQPLSILRRWGADPDAVLARNPKTVIVTVTCYGTDGPWGDKVGNGSLAEAFAGLTNMTGEADGPPLLPSVALGDSLVGMAGALAALAACWSGVGQHVDVTQYEPVLALLGPLVAAWEPGTEPPGRTGSRVPGGVPRNVYAGSDDRYLVLSATTDAQVGRLLGVLGITDRADDFGRSEARLARADELDGIVADWIRARPRDEAVAAFEAARLPVVAVQDLAEIAAHPQVRARGSLAEVEGVLLPNALAGLQGTPAVLRPAPTQPVDVDAVVGEWVSRTGR
jgi:formyl-CoA transferase